MEQYACCLAQVLSSPFHVPYRLKIPLSKCFRLWNSFRFLDYLHSFTGWTFLIQKSGSNNALNLGLLEYQKELGNPALLASTARQCVPQDRRRPLRPRSLGQALSSSRMPLAPTNCKETTQLCYLTGYIEGLAKGTYQVVPGPVRQQTQHCGNTRRVQASQSDAPSHHTFKSLPFFHH